MHVSDPNSARPSELARGWQVQPEKASAPAPVAPTEENADPSDGLSSVALMLLGVFGGLTLLYTWGWFEVARAYSLVNSITASGSGLVGGILQQIIFWVAPLAPATWFLTAFLMNRQRGAFPLGVALLLGAILTLPYPMLVGGTVA